MPAPLKLVYCKTKQIAITAAHFAPNNIKADTLKIYIYSVAPTIQYFCAYIRLTRLLFHDSACSLKQDTLNAVSLACAGSVRKKSVFSTSFAPGKNQWNG